MSSGESAPSSPPIQYSTSLFQAQGISCLDHCHSPPPPSDLCSLPRMLPWFTTSPGSAMTAPPPHLPILASNITLHQFQNFDTRLLSRHRGCSASKDHLTLHTNHPQTSPIASRRGCKILIRISLLPEQLPNHAGQKAKQFICYSSVITCFVA